VGTLKNKTESQYGISFIPGILLNDLSTPLTEIGLDEYEKGHDRLHNSKGHMYNMFELFSKESGFKSLLAFQNLKNFLGRESFKEHMNGSDWRYYFVLYEKTLLPSIQYKKEDASFLLQSWLEIQFICYQGILFGKTRKLELRFFLMTFLHGLYASKRWGKKIMGLYLHVIWIHWPKDFHKTNFQQEGTDIHEAWLATCKRILRYNTNRKKDCALTELITRLAMEDFLSNETPTKEEKWNRISKEFKNYKWREIFVPTDWIQKSREEWFYFIQRLKEAGFSEEKGYFKISPKGIQFYSLPLNK